MGYICIKWTAFSCAIYQHFQRISVLQIGKKWACRVKRVYLTQKTIGHIQHLYRGWSALGLNTFGLEVNDVETLGFPPVPSLRSRLLAQQRRYCMEELTDHLFRRGLHNTESARWYHQSTVGQLFIQEKPTTPNKNYTPFQVIHFRLGLEQ